MDEDNMFKMERPPTPPPTPLVGLDCDCQGEEEEEEEKTRKSLLEGLVFNYEYNVWRFDYPSFLSPVPRHPPEDVNEYLQAFLREMTEN